jgi:Uma2 family endonuclease
MLWVAEVEMETATLMPAEAQALGFVPVEVYLTTSYSPDCDYVDGEVQERNVGETSHSSAKKFFITFFAINEKKWGVRVFPEDRIQISATRYRVADLCAVRRETPLEQIIRTPPLLCVEVLSPEDRVSRTQEKVDDYIQMGVQAVWVIDPRRRRVWVAENTVTMQRVEDVLTLKGTDIRVPVADIFSEMDEMMKLA